MYSKRLKYINIILPTDTVCCPDPQLTRSMLLDDDDDDDDDDASGRNIIYAP